MLLTKKIKKSINNTVENEIYTIIDLEGYVQQMRNAAAESLCEGYTENLDEFIGVGQVINVVKNECLGFDDLGRPLLDEQANERIFEKIAIWIHNVGLAKLAGKDLIECSWDDKSNEMIFWSKNT